MNGGSLPNPSLDGERVFPRDDLGGTEGVACPECGKRLLDVQALALHRFRAHGVERSLRRKVDGSMCVACLQHFSSMELLLNHLAEKSLRCYVVYTIAIPDLSAEECSAAHSLHQSQVSTVLQLGFPRNHATHPVFRAPGPLTSLAYKVGIHHRMLLKCQPCTIGIRGALSSRADS